MAALAASQEPGFEALLAGDLDKVQLHALADRMAALHAAALKGDGTVFRKTLALEAATDTQRAELDGHQDSIARRIAAGRIRAIAGEPMDVLHDLARPVLAVMRAGMAGEANMLANRYLDIAPQGATGWALLPLYLSLRTEGETELADSLLAPARPRLVVIGGLSGTGKSTLARLLGGRIGRLPGARVLRSDVFRKRLAGVSPETRLPPRHYTRRNDDETYEALFESTDDHLACGNSVIVDAVFMSRSERDVVEALADRYRAAFTGIWLEAPEKDRIARVNARENDASDATEKVVREQSKRPVGEIHWHRIRANRPQELIVAAARAALDRAA
jgi:predicted kinase